MPDFRFDVYTFLQHKMPDDLDNIQKLHDKIVRHKVVSDNFTIEFAELLVKAGEGRTQVLAQIRKWNKKALNALSKNLKNPKFAKEFFEGVKTNPGLVDGWKLASKQVSIRGSINWIKKIDGWVKTGASNSDIVKLVNEVAGNPTLKAAFEADEVVFDAWKWIDEGIPTLPYGQPTTYINYLKKKTIYINQASDKVETVKYYRVQEAGIDGPEEILSLDENGNVIFGFSSNNWLNFSTNNIDHAMHFKDLGVPGTRYVIEFEMPKSFDDALKRDAIPQWSSTNNKDYLDGLAPQIADPNQPGHPFTTRKWSEYWRSEFQQNVVPGSGRIINIE